MEKYIWIIYGAISLTVLILYGADKAKAKAGAWRIPERTLLLAAVFSPAAALLGMLVFRHKIRKPKFYLGVPLILILESGLLWYLYFRH